MAAGAAERPTYRKLGARDAPAYASHLRRLDARDRQARFAAALASGAVDAHVARLDWDGGGGTLVLGCLVGGALRATAELHRTARDPRTAEAALSVEGPFQGRGLGAELARRLVLAARNRAVRRVHLLCLPANVRVRRIAAGLGGGVAALEEGVGGLAAAGLDLLPATPFTLLAEQLDDVRALAAALADAGGWPARLAAGTT